MFNGKNNDCWKSILPLINWFNRPSASIIITMPRRKEKVITKDRHRVKRVREKERERERERERENLIENSLV